MNRTDFKTLSETGRIVGLFNQFVELLAQTGLREVRDHQSRGIGREAKRERPLVSFHSLRHSAVSILKAAGSSVADNFGERRGDRGKVKVQLCLIECRGQPRLYLKIGLYGASLREVD